MNFQTNPVMPNPGSLQTAMNSQQNARTSPINGGVGAILGSWKQQRRDMLGRIPEAANPAADLAVKQMQPNAGVDPAMQQELIKNMGGYGMEPMQPSPGETTPFYGMPSQSDQNAQAAQLSAQGGGQPSQFADQASQLGGQMGGQQFSGFGPPNGTTGPYARMAMNPQISALMNSFRQRQNGARNVGGGDIGLPTTTI